MDAKHIQPISRKDYEIAGYQPKSLAARIVQNQLLKQQNSTSKPTPKEIA